MEHDHHRKHRDGHIHLDKADWGAMAADAELEGEVLLPFVTDAAVWVTELRGQGSAPVGRVIDIGSGPGVGTCELARQFPDATVIAVDGSPAMLERATRRAAAHGLASRISTHVAELPSELDGFDPADVIWASMSLHHMGDEVQSLRVLRELLGPHGLLAIAELAEPMRVLPVNLDVGSPGLAGRLESAAASWFADMRGGLTGTVPSADLTSMVTSAGFVVVGSQIARLHLDAPLSDDARRLALRHLTRTRAQLDEYLDADDLGTLDALIDVDDQRGVMQRRDVVVVASRQIVIATPD